MAKQIVTKIKLQVPAGQANPSPPVGRRIGPAWCEYHGVLQGFQCPDSDPSRNDHSSGCNRLCRPFVFVHYENLPPGR